MLLDTCIFSWILTRKLKLFSRVMASSTYREESVQIGS